MLAWAELLEDNWRDVIESHQCRHALQGARGVGVARCKDQSNAYELRENLKL